MIRENRKNDIKDGNAVPAALKVLTTMGTMAFASFFLSRDTMEVSLRLTGIAGGYQIGLIPPAGGTSGERGVSYLK